MRTGSTTRSGRGPSRAGTSRFARRSGLVPLLLAGSLAFALALPPGARVLLAAYLATTTLYTLSLKRKVLVDVFTLAFLYTLRVLLGGAATGVPVSPWLLAFSVFLFLSLAFAKRASELLAMKERGHDAGAGRDWFVWDSLVVQVLGVASAYLSGLVLAIYIQSDVTKRLYAHPGWLWLLVPALLYWTSRVWVLVGPGGDGRGPDRLRRPRPGDVGARRRDRGGPADGGSRSIRNPGPDGVTRGRRGVVESARATGAHQRRRRPRNQLRYR